MREGTGRKNKYIVKDNGKKKNYQNTVRQPTELGDVISDLQKLIFGKAKTKTVDELTKGKQKQMTNIQN